MLEKTLLQMQGTALAEGIVTGFEDGKILVESSEANIVFCRFVRSSDGPALSLNPGDKVLFAKDPERQEGYVLGIVEPVLSGNLANLEIEAPVEKVEINLPTNKENLVINGKKLTLEADQEIELKCGKGAIVIRKDGKILIRGTNLVSRSSGANKIKGASVAIN